MPLWPAGSQPGDWRLSFFLQVSVARALPYWHPMESADLREPIVRELARRRLSQSKLCAIERIR